MKTAIYLRKSRADEEAEKKGEFETLNRHRSTLLKVAKDQNLNIVEIKEELVSGESVAYRPKMLELLEEVKQGLYDAVLVMDIDRLGRGNMSDQGLILETFKKSNTKIITPRKIYDLQNEFDEEYSEFEAFMARKELKLITRRMQRGRIKSIEEGKYIAQCAPFGYKIEYLNNAKDRVLLIDEEKSEIVKIIYDMYLKGIGAYKISSHLNTLALKTSTGRSWYEKAIRDIIKNKTYCGYVVWNRVERKKNSQRTRPIDEQIEAKGNHEPIISEETWYKAQEIRKKRSIPPISNKTLSNPLAGLVKCKCCGATMTCSSSIYKNVDGYVKFLRCKNCKNNRGVKLKIIEQEVLNNLYIILKNYNLPTEYINLEENTKLLSYNKLLENLKKENQTLVKQKERLQDFLERGIYDIDTYLERSKILSNKISENTKNIYNLKKDIEYENQSSLSIESIIPTIKNVLEEYSLIESASDKNKLLKSVIKEIIYFKQPGKRNAKFEIDITPILNKLI